MFRVLALELNLWLCIASPLISVFVLLVFYKGGVEKSRMVLVFLLDLFLPIIGMLSVLVFYIFSRKVSDSEFEGFIVDTFFEKSYRDYSLEIDGKIASINQKIVEKWEKLPTDLASYGEIFMSGNNQLKLSAIERLSRTTSKESVTLLKMALKDPSYEVSYFANGALDKIEKRFIDHIHDISKSISLYPHSSDLLFDRATAYLKFYKYDLLDGLTSQRFLEKSLYDFLSSIQLNTTSVESYYRVIEIYYLKGQYQLVLSFFEKAKNLLCEKEMLYEKALSLKTKAFYYLNQKEEYYQLVTNEEGRK